MSEPSPGAVRPIVRLFFACDSAVYDLADDRWELKNPWHTVGMPPGVRKKHIERKLMLYSQLTDGVGEFQLAVELRYFDAGRQLVLGRSHPERRSFPGGNQLDVMEVVFRMDRVPFPRPDLYEFRLLADGAELEGGTMYLRVFSGEAL